MNDGAEVRAGTDPSDSASVFAITGVEMSPSGTSVVLSWSSVSNRLYALWGSTSLLEGFSMLSNNIPATPPINTYTDLAGGVMHRFYRVQVQP